MYPCDASKYDLARLQASWLDFISHWQVSSREEEHGFDMIGKCSHSEDQSLD